MIPTCGYVLSTFRDNLNLYRIVSGKNVLKSTGIPGKYPRVSGSSLIKSGGVKMGKDVSINTCPGEVGLAVIIYPPKT